MYKLEPACWDDFRAAFLKELTDETTPNTRVNPISGISIRMFRGFDSFFAII